MCILINRISYNISLNGKPHLLTSVLFSQWGIPPQTTFLDPHDQIQFLHSLMQTSMTAFTRPRTTTGPIIPTFFFLYIYWAGGPIWRHLVVQGWVNVVMEFRISEWRNWIWSWRSRKVVRGEMPHRLSKVEVRRCSLPSRATFRDILLIRIHIMKAQDKGKLWNI